MIQKSELRKIVRLRKREFDQRQLAELSLAIMARLKAEPHFAQAKTVMLYAALPDEVDTTTLLKNTEGKTIILPKVTGDTTMETRLFRRWEDLSEGKFNILEPNGPLFTDYEAIDVVVVPGMAFDRDGNRLGRGKGYYDRFLTELPDHIYKIGVCFDFQKFDHIPADDNDVAMDIVV
ncbi:MAG: 5-formyltetrahydrofolate cyclo-ligase [Prevotella sp.]